MVRLNKQMVAVLALGLAIPTLATPSFAQQSDEGSMSSERQKSMRDCNVEAGKMTQHTWGDHQIHKYRACMMQHGEQEQRHSIQGGRPSHPSRPQPPSCNGYSRRQHFGERGNSGIAGRRPHLQGQRCARRKSVDVYPSPPANQLTLISSVFLAFFRVQRCLFSCRVCCMIFTSIFRLPAAPCNMNERDMSSEPT